MRTKRQQEILDGKPIVVLFEARRYGEGLSGIGVHHPKLPDGEYIITSPIVGEAHNVIETRNTRYVVASWAE